MKIKLQDYSLISNEWIETQINVVKGLDGILKSSDSKAILNVYDLIKQQLIPSEKLAEISFNTGFNSGMELSKQELEQLQAQKERDTKEALKVIKQIQSGTYRNREKRIEFAQMIMRLATSNCKEASKFVWKLSEFAKFYGDDEMISEDEWFKLNNAQFEESEVDKILNLKEYKFERK